MEDLANLDPLLESHLKRYSCEFENKNKNIINIRVENSTFFLSLAPTYPETGPNDYIKINIITCSTKNLKKREKKVLSKFSPN